MDKSTLGRAIEAVKAKRQDDLVVKLLCDVIEEVTACGCGQALTEPCGGLCVNQAIGAQLLEEITDAT